MADLEISNLPSVTVPLPTDALAMVNDLVTKQITRAQMHTLLPGELLVLPNGDDPTNPEIQFPNSGIYEDLNDELAFSQDGVKVGHLTTPAAGGLFIDNQITGGGLERVLTTSDGASFGEYQAIFDASIGTFPVTSASGDWFNTTVVGTVDGQPFIVGDILVALVDNPSTTIFAANWTIVPHIAGTVPASTIANSTLRADGSGAWEQQAFFRVEGTLASDTRVVLENTTDSVGSIDDVTVPFAIGDRVASGSFMGMGDRAMQAQAGGIGVSFNINPFGGAVGIGRQSSPGPTDNVNLHGIDTFVRSGDLRIAEQARPNEAGVGANGLFWVANDVPNHAMFTADDTDQWAISHPFTAPAGAYYYRGLTGSPLASQIRFNNATILSATTVSVHETNDDGVDISAWLDAYFVDGATFHFQGASNYQAWYSMTLSGVSDAGTFRTATITHVDDGGVVAETEEKVFFSLSPAAADVTKVGTPVDNELGVWTGDGTIEGDSNLTWDATKLGVLGTISLVERATAPADVAASGQFWVRNDVPNRPFFTDDSGIDTLLDPGISTVDVENGNYTFALTDKGLTKQKESGGAGETYTIPANASISFEVGTLIGISNDGGGDLSIAITTDTLIFADDNTTGTRTLADGGMAVIQKLAATVWKIAGAGLT